MNINTELRSTCDISLKTWLTEKEASIYACVSRPLLLKAREDGKLPFIHVLDKKIVYERVALDNWIKSFSKKSDNRRK